MFYVAFDNKDKTDKKIYIKHSYSVKGVKKQIVIEKYDSANQLSKEHGSWEKFIKERIKALNEEKKNKNLECKLLPIDYTTPILDTGIQLNYNFGYLLMQKVYHNLELDQFFYHLKNNNKLRIKYSLNDVMKFLTYSRAIIPGSKLETSKRTDYYAEQFDITLEDIYDALDRFNEYKSKLQSYIYKRAKLLLPPTNKVIYYDVTNFYYEIELENDLCAYGVEKNHRPDPITSFGLFMDSNGIPIRYADYRGNISEKTQALNEWKSLEKELPDDGYIVCADAGLNTSDLKHLLITKHNHYLFSQSVKILGKTATKEMFESDGWIPLNDHKRYKIKKFLKDSYIHDENSKRKDNKKKVGIDTMYIMTFDENRRKYLLNKIEERLNKAKDIIKNPSNYDKVSTTNGKQYIKKIVFDNNGEIIVEQSLLQLDLELIEKEKKFAGYGALVTDLFNENVTTLLNIAAGRWEIEDCFRQMKTGFSTRPVYVRTVEHIHAHFLTCYVALTITKLLERKYLTKISAAELFDILRDTCYSKLPTGDWMACNVSKNAVYAFKELGFKSLLFKNISNNTYQNAITLSKKRDF